MIYKIMIIQDNGSHPLLELWESWSQARDALTSQRHGIRGGDLESFEKSMCGCRSVAFQS